MLDFGLDVSKLVKTQQNLFDKCEVTIIDFGFATPYIDKITKKHLDKRIINNFRGSMVFSS